MNTPFEVTDDGHVVLHEALIEEIAKIKQPYELKIFELQCQVDRLGSEVAELRNK